MAQPTSGPLEMRVSAFGGDVGVRGPGTGVVAEFYADIRHNGENAREEALANARMFQASHDLLKAARTIIRAATLEYRIKAGADDEWIYDELGSEMSQAYFDARAAIAKAEGRDDG